MRLHSLTIENYKNLNNFTINFDEDALTTVIIGRNGAGKSNLLEALVIIFRDLDLGIPPVFKYQLNYDCRGYRIHIDADPQRPRRNQMIIKVGKKGEFSDEVISYQRFSQQSERRYLPSYVFGYYAGLNDNLEKLFDTHQKRFYEGLIHGIDIDKPLRPLIYAHPIHRQFAPLSFFIEQDQEIVKFLEEHLGIQAMDSVLFVMKQPPWKSKDGDPRFWNARGVVQRFLNELYSLAFAPLRLKQHVNLGWRKSTNLEHLYLLLKDRDAFEDLYRKYENRQAFFYALESTYMSSIISEVKIRVKVRYANGLLDCRNLSEGEQQLLMALGLLRFTKEDEALFLLDEPDTYLNPVWGIQYLDFLNEIVGEQPTSHIIMTTHNPLVISSLERSQVQMMRRDDKTGRVFASMPEENPRGMGVAAILTSDLFGLRSTLDPPTQRLLDERRILVVKEHLSYEEKLRLDELNEQLEGLDFSITLRDSLYEKFVKAMTLRERPEVRRLVYLTPEQQEEQRQLVLSILRELREEEESNMGEVH